MLRSEFEALFERARRRAVRWPRLFRLAVTLRATVGVGTVALMGAGGVALVGWALSPLFDGGFMTSPWWTGARVLAVFPGLGLLFFVAKVLRVRFPPPEGILLSREDAPNLFALLEGLRRRFGTPPIHFVRVTGDLNAAITQRPGPVGMMRNTLIVGLPLALAVTPRQFVAVLAHEFGHLSRQRIALGGWGCYLRALWHQALENMETIPSLLQPLFAALARMETPVYCAESLVLSHLDELEADEAAAEVVGARRLGQALAEVALKHRFLADDFWRKVYAQADRAKRPTFLPYRHMAAALRAGFDRSAAADWFEEAGDASDAAELSTHPTLRERVRALGLDEPDLAAGGDHAAQRFFGDVVPRLASELDQRWWQGHRRTWRQRHWEVSHALERIARLEAEGQQLGVPDRLELALLVERYAGDRDPLAVYRDVLPDAPGRPEALLGMGRLLISRGDPTGVAYLRRALAEDDAVGLQAAALLIEHYENCGCALAAAPYRKRLAKLLRQASLVQMALDAPIESLRCLTPGLEMYELRSLVRELRRHSAIRRAYVVRRRCELTPRWRAYILAVCIRADEWDSAETIAQQVESCMAICALWRVVPILAGGSEEKCLAEVKGARIFSRRKPMECGEAAEAEESEADTHEGG